MLHRSGTHRIGASFQLVSGAALTLSEASTVGGVAVQLGAGDIHDQALEEVADRGAGLGFGEEDQLGERGRPGHAASLPGITGVCTRRPLAASMTAMFRMVERNPCSHAARNGRYWARTSDPQLVELVLSQLS